MAKNGLDTSERSARLVPMVFPLLHGSATARRGRPPDRALEGDEAPRCTNQETLRAGRPDVPPAPAPGAVALGLRQSEHLSDDPQLFFRLRLRLLIPRGIIETAGP